MGLPRGAFFFESTEECIGVFFDNCINTYRCMSLFVCVTQKIFRIPCSDMVSQCERFSFEIVANLYVWGVDPLNICKGLVISASDSSTDRSRIRINSY